MAFYQQVSQRQDIQMALEKHNDESSL